MLYRQKWLKINLSIKIVSYELPSNTYYEKGTSIFLSKKTKFSGLCEAILKWKTGTVLTHQLQHQILEMTEKEK